MNDRRQVDIGTVIFLDPAVLDGDMEILCPYSPSEEARPYVCLAMESDLSVWLALTSQPGKNHFPIPQDVRSPQKTMWAAGPCFVNQTFATHVGPTTRFLLAVSPDDLLDGVFRRNIRASWVREQLIPRCRVPGANWFHSWKPGCGAGHQTPAPTTAKLVRPLLSASEKEKIKPPPTPPTPPVKEKAEVTPTAENWAEFIDAAPGGKGPGRR